MSEIQASATAQGAVNAQNPGMRQNATRGVPERGSSMMEGQTTPIEVRNPESSIRRLTDQMIAFTYG